MLSSLQRKWVEKLVIYESKCTFQGNKVTSLLEKALWQIYAKRYIFGFTNSKDWDMIVIRAIFLYQDNEYNWHLRVEEYQHLNQVAQILMDKCFLDNGKLFKNYSDLVEGKNNSQKGFLEYKDIKNFLKYFDYFSQDLKLINQQFVEEDQSYAQKFSQLKINEEKQTLIDIIRIYQPKQIEELFQKKNIQTTKLRRTSILTPSKEKLVSQILLNKMLRSSREAKKKTI